jgi:hypothetical protein
VGSSKNTLDIDIQMLKNRHKKWGAQKQALLYILLILISTSKLPPDRHFSRAERCVKERMSSGATAFHVLPFI